MTEKNYEFENIRTLESEVANSIEELFGGDEERAREMLLESVPSLLSYREENPRAALRSTGFSGGAHKLDRYVITTAGDEDEAEKATRINELVGETYPELVMPMKNAGNFLFGINFTGLRLDEPKFLAEVNAPRRIIENHLRNSIRLSTLDLHSVISKDEYRPEAYEEKFSENFSALEEVAEKEISRESIEKLLPRYYGMASQPFWDQNLQNAKYTEEGDIKNFDWKKATRNLVIPVYEPVQIAHNFGRDISDLRELARAEYDALREEGVDVGFEPFEFDTLWEMGTLYFLTRRIFYGHKHDNTSRVKKYFQMLRECDFKLEAGQRLVRELE